jgi:hypothetical protein
VAVAPRDARFCPHCGRHLGENSLEFWPPRFRLANTETFIRNKLLQLRSFRWLADKQSSGPYTDLPLYKLAHSLWMPRRRDEFLDEWRFAVDPANLGCWRADGRYF